MCWEEHAWKSMSNDVFYPFLHAGAWHGLEGNLLVIVINCCDVAHQWLMKCL